ncbi:MAG: hypothetical protein K940chlam7_01235 [Chlamydiae bacterium]|nr:hypothetical protein [Chlamydiota bacterium]
MDSYKNRTHEVGAGKGNKCLIPITCFFITLFGQQKIVVPSSLSHIRIGFTDTWVEHFDL